MVKIPRLITNKLSTFGLIVAVTLCTAPFCRVSAAELLVLYPDVRVPFSKIFEDISSGAEEGFKGKASSEPVSENYSTNQLLNQKKPDVILALGKSSLANIEKAGSKLPILLGAVSGQKYNYPGISMIPDPKIILGNLTLLSPSVGRIHVVKKSKGRDLQLDGAGSYLKSIGKELVIYESEDLREAANIYARLIDEAKENDAVWILQDGSYVNNAILSLLLDAAWNKNLVVFSSNPVHVKRGALFAVYPDNKRMGISLGQMANNALEGSAEAGMTTLKDTLLAVNERTSNHLGISLSKEVKENVNLLLPAR